MLLKGSIKLSKNSAKFLKTGVSWIYSNELEKIDKTIPVGSWVSIEGAGGQVLGYGHFNPHSLYSVRIFETAPFRSEEQTRALFFKKLDHAFQMRVSAYPDSNRSMRLVFGESDGVPGLVVDLFETKSSKGVAVIQCHSAGAENFIFWTQQWLQERLDIDSGIIRNDLEVRKREFPPSADPAKVQYVTEWGNLDQEIYANEGGIRFPVNVRTGQKTGYFYDLRDNRKAFAQRVARMKAPKILDCFSFIGSWGLQALKNNPQATLVAADSSKEALEALKNCAKLNGLQDRVETVCTDLFKDRQFFEKYRGHFDAVVMDPPSTTSSAKQAAQGKRVHEKCFTDAIGCTKQDGVIALAACSFHMTWDEFLEISHQAARGWNRTIRISHFGNQSADHPVLSSMPESRYIKCLIGDFLL